MPEIHRNIPDSAGLTAFRADPAMRRLLEVYLDAETFAALRKAKDEAKESGKARGKGGGGKTRKRKGGGDG